MIGAALRGGVLAALMLGAAAAPVWADKPIPADAQAQADPAVKRGTFPNGLRYALMRNATPAGAV